jgi:thymidylate synthase
MFQGEFKGINSFLRDSCRLLLSEGILRDVRGHRCFELPEPYMFKITQPTARWVTIPARKWNVALPYAESLWLASGRNDMAFITHYLKHMSNYSDDGFYMRGGYGPRFRHYNGTMIDYQIADTDFNVNCVDQFAYIEACFKEDKDTRRAVISLGDPMKDEFDEKGQLKQTKDIPCTRMLHFIQDANTHKLNLVVNMRSNDLLWGASAVNIFNYTFMLEYFSCILGLEMGSYFHIANNFHYYENLQNMVKDVARVDGVEDEPYEYTKTFHSLSEFDQLVLSLSKEEELMRTSDCYQYTPIHDVFFNDWYNVLYAYNFHKEVKFNNPVLQKLRISNL